MDSTNLTEEEDNKKEEDDDKLSTKLWVAKSVNFYSNGPLLITQPYFVRIFVNILLLQF